MAEAAKANAVKHYRSRIRQNSEAYDGSLNSGEFSYLQITRKMFPAGLAGLEARPNG